MCVCVSVDFLFSLSHFVSLSLLLFFLVPWLPKKAGSACLLFTGWLKRHGWCPTRFPGGRLDREQRVYLLPLHGVRWFTTDSRSLCAAVFSLPPRWVPGLEVLKKYYALLTKYSDSHLIPREKKREREREGGRKRECAMKLCCMKVRRQVKVGCICNGLTAIWSKPAPIEWNDVYGSIKKKKRSTFN